jgi:hypothetical protein
MNTVSKLLVSVCVLFLPALPLAGCGAPPWESGMALAVKVDSPRDGTTVNTSTVTVSGHVLGSQKAAAKVRINDADVPVKDDKFSGVTTLSEGKNTIIVVATASGATPSQKVTVTYVPAK